MSGHPVRTSFARSTEPELDLGWRRASTWQLRGSLGREASTLTTSPQVQLGERLASAFLQTVPTPISNNTPKESMGLPEQMFVQLLHRSSRLDAIRKRIFVSCSAGNSGPTHFTLSNKAPWSLTVAASTLDRSITATTKLGNTEEFDGESLYHQEESPFATIESHPLVSKWGIHAPRWLLYGLYV